MGGGGNSARPSQRWDEDDAPQRRPPPPSHRGGGGGGAGPPPSAYSTSPGGTRKNVVWRDDGGGRGDGNRGHLADVRVMTASAERPRASAQRGRKPDAGSTSSLLRAGESGETKQILPATSSNAFEPTFVESNGVLRRG